jgi:hypothetical protein
MTLSRKWEQLYYVHLAQEVNRGDGVSLDKARERAAIAMATVDRRWFMKQVARGTASELARLHLWREALQLVRAFATDVGPATAMGMAVAVLASRVRV